MNRLAGVLVLTVTEYRTRGERIRASKVASHPEKGRERDKVVSAEKGCLATGCKPEPLLDKR